MGAKRLLPARISSRLSATSPEGSADSFEVCPEASLHPTPPTSATSTAARNLEVVTSPPPFRFGRKVMRLYAASNKYARSSHRRSARKGMSAPGAEGARRPLPRDRVSHSRLRDGAL